MSEPEIQEALRDSVSEVLEKMFFVRALGETPVPRPAGSPPPPEITARLLFQGEPPGSLTVRLTCAAARSIAADFLGDDVEAVSGRQTAEVVCELANMICGSLLSRVEGATTFHLAAPQIVASSERAEGPSTTVYAVDLAHGPLTVTVTTETPICPQPAQSAS
jgi:CheY-specific phosphatase CheX